VQWGQAVNFCFVLPNLSGGGAERAELTLSEGLIGRGHHVSMILFDDTSAFEIPDGLKINILVPAGQKFSGGYFGKRQLARLLAKCYARISPAGGFDVTIASLPFANEITRIAKIDAWHHIQNNLSAEIAKLAERNPFKALRRRWRYRNLYEGQRVIAVSKGVAADLRDALAIKTARTEIIYNPFDLVSIRQRASEPAINIPAQPYVIHASRFMRQKRHDVLLDAYKMSGIPHDLVLLTDPEDALKALIEDRQLASQVRIAGYQKNPYAWFAKAAALILSSDREGFGNVLVEALACGTPVISTNCPSGPNEILTGGLAAFLSPVGDAATLAANLRKAVGGSYPIKEAHLERFEANSAVDAIEKLARVPS
jgi:glycosyltransferase involved in cell wall biosynthesis